MKDSNAGMDPRERDAKRLKEKERQELLDRAYQRVVGSKLEQLSKKKVTTGMYPFKNLDAIMPILALQS